MKLILLILLCRFVLEAQSPSRTSIWIADRIKDARLRVQNNNAEPVRTTFSLAFATEAIATLLIEREFRASNPTNQSLAQSIWALADSQLDKQVGAVAPTAAGTSLAMKGVAPSILGFAVENGAITRDVSGTVVTFRTTPSMLVKALEGQPFESLFKINSDSSGAPTKEWGDWADKFSFFASFDTSKDNQANTLLANRRQLNSFGGRAELFNTRKVNHRRYFARYQHLADTEGLNYLLQRRKLQDFLRNDSRFKKWHADLDLELRNFDACISLASDTTMKIACIEAPPDGSRTLEQVLRANIAELLNPQFEFDKNAQTLLVDYAKAMVPLIAGTAEIREFANRGILATLDWTVSRDAILPDLSTITAVVEGGVGKGRKYDLTTNFASSFYFRRPAANIGQFHSFKGTGQFDIPLGSLAQYGPFVFTLAGRYEYIPNNTLSPATNLLADPASTTTPTTTPAAALAPTLQGNIWVGQAKLTIPVKGMPVKIPLSLTWANRTELIKEKEVRVSFGFTFDLDALIAKNAK